jgi:hypothetical protein
MARCQSYIKHSHKISANASRPGILRAEWYLVVEIYLKGVMFRLNNVISKVINFLETGLIIQ